MNKITINGIELELTDEQAAELVEQYQAKQSDFPQEGKPYYFITENGCVDFLIYATPQSMVPIKHNTHTWRQASGNCFRTREEAEHYRDYLVALNTLKKSSDFKPDWEDGEQKKWSVYYTPSRNTFCESYDCNVNYAPHVYFRTSEEAEAALSKYHREFEIVYGVRSEVE